MITDEQLESAEKIILINHALVGHLRTYREIGDKDEVLARTMNKIAESIEITVGIMGNLLAEIKDLTGR